MGKKMRDHLRFSCAWWHTFCAAGNDQFGEATLAKPWEKADSVLEMCKQRVDAAFEFFTKLGIDYYCFHDRDIAPELATPEETNKLLDQVTDYMLEKQKETGVKLLWATANMFGAPRFMNGASTNPDASVFAAACAQVKKAMELCQKLGGVNYVFWGGREGYQSILNSIPKEELDHMARFMHMAVDYKKKIGATFQLLIEPKPREPTKHQYDYDAQTVLGFLRTYGLENDFKLNIEPNHTTLAGHDYEHDIVIAAQYGMLGSVDANTGDTLLGWDTDQFLMDTKKAVICLLAIIKAGGLHSGGLNFDAKVRRESIDLEDRFIAHIGSMDVWAHALLIVEQILKDGKLDELVNQRYASYTTGLGKKIHEGAATFEECEQYIFENGFPKPTSAKQEMFEVVLNKYLNKY